MERNKLETQFKEQLNSREIKPSDRAWDRLDAMLTVAEKKKQKRGYAWVYAAASFAGFAFLGTFFFTQTDKNATVERNEVVLENNQKDESKKEALLVISLDSTSRKVVEISEAKKVKKNSRDGSPTLKIQNQVAQNSNPESLISIIEKRQTNQKTVQFDSSNTNEKSIDEMLASVKTVSKAENLKTTVKVNPDALLSQVDGELELSFREKVINKVNRNYQTVKVVLANRNQE